MAPAEAPPVPAVQVVRCAIYTRKSTEEGLDKEFNSLEAQRECAEAYIQSQRPAGWISVPQRYDDGGFTGSHLERPGLLRLLKDIESRAVDCVVVYKVDRLSRSLFDFARLMRAFETHAVSFVSVTQQLNSHTPMGRLTLHVLLSFAQFEREIIGERTRDKQSAARRKGQWMGGYPPLGYDPAPGGGRLVVNHGEAEQVRQIFALFVGQAGSVLGTLEQVQQRGGRMKSWTTREGKRRGGRAFDEPALLRLLSNELYGGEVRHKGTLYPGQHESIVEAALLRQVQQLLRKRKRSDERVPSNRSGGVLKGLLECQVCGRAMVSESTRKGEVRYDYYVCARGRKKGAAACPRQSVPAQRIEQAVVDQLREMARDGGRQLLADALVGERSWEEMERSERHGMLQRVLEGIRYDGQTGQCRMRLRATVAGTAEPEMLVQTRKARFSQTRPERWTVAQWGPLPRITRLMALAIRMEGLLRDGVVPNYTELARVGRVSRARITQIMNLRNLAPAIQERILLLEQAADGKVVEAALRRLSEVLDWREQIRAFEKLAGARPE